MSRLSLSLASSAVALLICAPAQGADSPPRKAPPEPPPVFTWTGAYIGMTFAHTWTASEPISVSGVNVYDATLQNFGPASALGATGVIDARLNGFLAGVQAGYNWQFAERFVAGLEAEVEGAGVRGGGGFGGQIAAGPGAYAVTGASLDRSLDYFGSVRGRFGYAVKPTLLIYATGGLAFGGAGQTAKLQQTLVPSALVTRGLKIDQFQNLVGWTIGAGAELALSRALSAKLEYLYYDLGALASRADTASLLAFRTLLGATRLIDAAQSRTRINGHQLRVGLNYRFDWSVPPSASGATALFADPRFVAAAAPMTGDWRFKVTLPYLWALATNGSLTARGNTVGANASFIDGFTQTSSFPLAFAGRIEARNGPLAAYADYAWFQARFAGSTLILRSPTLDAAIAANAATRLKQTMAFGEAGIAYEAARFTLNGSQSETALDVYAGARYVYFGADIRLDAAAAAQSALLGVETVGGRSVTRTNAIRWVDPLVGVGLRHQISSADEFQLRGDIGGFGAGSKFSWQAYGGYNHDFELLGLKMTTTIAYRALAVDYSSGWGAARKGVNAIFHGPLTGVSMRF